MLLSEFDEDLEEGLAFFLHLLMVAAALFGLACRDEGGHGLEDLVGSAEVFENKVAVTDF